MITSITTSDVASRGSDVESPAAGLLYKTGSAWDVTLRVRAGNMKSLYKLDRWD